MLYSQITAPNISYRATHTHPQEEIMFVVEGEGVLITPDGDFPFEPGCLFITPPNYPHATKSKNGHRIISIGERLDAFSFLTQAFLLRHILCLWYNILV